MAADTVNRDALDRFIDRLEIHYGERKELNETIRGVYEEIREAGMDAETVRVMVKERALDPQIRHDQYAIRDEYRRALGLYADTPLGEAMEPPVDPKPAEWPRPFAEQTIHPTRHTRKRKTVDDAPEVFSKGEPAGTA